LAASRVVLYACEEKVKNLWAQLYHTTMRFKWRRWRGSGPSRRPSALESNAVGSANEKHLEGEERAQQTPDGPAVALAASGGDKEEVDGSADKSEDMALIFALGSPLGRYSSQSTISARLPLAAPMTVSAAP